MRLPNFLDRTITGGLDSLWPTEFRKLVGEMPANHQTSRVEEPPYLPADDGLLARKSGPWAKRKHHYLCNIRRNGAA
jgi:hypothetical protein